MLYKKKLRAHHSTAHNPLKGPQKECFKFSVFLNKVAVVNTILAEKNYLWVWFRHGFDLLSSLTCTPFLKTWLEIARVRQVI